MNKELKIINKNKKTRRLLVLGFTLVETMVAISVLSLAVTGPMVIAQKGISSAVYARDEITAFYLAQEAIEYIRNVRDSNRSGATPWLSQFSVCTGVGQKCQINATIIDFEDAGAIQACSGGVCPKLAFDSTNNFYGYGTGGSWTDTIFTRDVVIAPVDTADIATANEAEISVTISWNTRLFTAVRTFIVKENILNF